MQMAANSLQMPVLTGPVEGTAIGNIMLQAKAAGLVNDIREMRRIISQSIEMKTYLPEDTAEWNKAYNLFTQRI
jgi:rhamnulokinase